MCYNSRFYHSSISQSVSERRILTEDILDSGETFMVKARGMSTKNTYLYPKLCVNKVFCTAIFWTPCCQLCRITQPVETDWEGRASRIQVYGEKHRMRGMGTL